MARPGVSLGPGTQSIGVLRAMKSVFAEQAMLADGRHDNVLVAIDDEGLIATVRAVYPGEAAHG